MFLYFSFFSLIFGLCTVGFYARQKKLISLIIIFLLFLFSAVRGEVGLDTQSYLEHYDKLESSDYVFHYMSQIEPGFALYSIAHKYLFDNSFSYLAIYSFFQCYLLWLLVRRLDGKSTFWFLISYVAIFYINNHFNVLRVGSALLIFMLALTGKTPKEKISLALLAPLFHVSVLFFYPLFFLKLTRASIFGTVVFLLSLAGLLYLKFDFFEYKFEAYSDYGSFDDSGFSKARLLLILGLFSSCFITARQSRYLFFATVYLAFSIFVAHWMPVLYRLINMSLLIYFYFLVREFQTYGYQLRKTLFWLIFGWYFFMTWSSIYYQTEELEKRIQAGEIKLERALCFTYVPYKFFWETSCNSD